MGMEKTKVYLRLYESYCIWINFLETSYRRNNRMAENNLAAVISFWTQGMSFYFNIRLSFELIEERKVVNLTSRISTPTELLATGTEWFVINWSKQVNDFFIIFK